MTRLWGPTPPSVHPALLFPSLPSLFSSLLLPQLVSPPALSTVIPTCPSSLFVSPLFLLLAFPPFLLLLCFLSSILLGSFSSVPSALCLSLLLSFPPFFPCHLSFLYLNPFSTLPSLVEFLIFLPFIFSPICFSSLPFPPSFPYLLLLFSISPLPFFSPHSSTLLHLSLLYFFTSSVICSHLSLHPSYLTSFTHLFLSSLLPYSHLISCVPSLPFLFSSLLF